MQALVIADTHGILEQIYDLHKEEIPQYDIIVLLGDHSTTDIKFAKMLAGRRASFIIFGNHDMPCHTTIKNMHGVLYNINPTFTGWQGSHKYKETQYYGYTQEESLKEYKKIPKADILFAHDGPYNNNKDDAHCGLKGITKYIKKNKPKSFIFGHLHKPDQFKLFNTQCYCTYQLSWFKFDIEGNVIEYKQFSNI